MVRHKISFLMSFKLDMEQIFVKWLPQTSKLGNFPSFQHFQIEFDFESSWFEEKSYFEKIYREKTKSYRTVK